MSAIEEILQEYVRMRGYGLEVKEALHALKIYIETLDHASRELLAQRLRAQESSKRVDPEEPAYQGTLRGNTTGAIWLECMNCRRKNRAKEVFCYGCGEILHSIDGHSVTKHFMQASDDLFDRAHFNQDSVLIMKAKNSEGLFEIRPQLEDRTFILGRGGKSKENLSLDIDLTDAKATALGVSRLHLGVQFDKNAEMLQIRDHGSANGTYINGQKLHASERRILRHGDELGLGRLILSVYFLHPGEEL